MAGRQAVLVGNSVIYKESRRSVTPNNLQGTLTRFHNQLGNLGDGHQFTVREALDKRPGEVKERFEAAAQQAKQANSLLLLYYFGHGTLSLKHELQFVHPANEILKLSALEAIVTEVECPKTLFIIDACYAGMAERSFTSALNPVENCRMASTTPSESAHVAVEGKGLPIGAFTQGILDAFTTSEACPSPGVNDVTARSFFDYALRRTKVSSPGQKPVMMGDLSEPLFRFTPDHDIDPGCDEEVEPKSAYQKLLAICRALYEVDARDIGALHRRLLKAHREVFITLYDLGGNNYEYREVAVEVVYRYVRFLRLLGLVTYGDLSLTAEGRVLARSWKARYNALLLDAIDGLLLRWNTSRAEVEEELRAALHLREMPTRAVVCERLRRRHVALPQGHLAMVLDLLGYIKAIRMARVPTYYPW